MDTPEVYLATPTYNQHIPNKETKLRVRDLIRAGVSHEGTARIIGISDATLRKYYRWELDNAVDDMVSQVASKAVELALEGNDKMVSLVLKTKGASRGWVEKQVIEHSVDAETKEMRERIKLLEQQADRDY